MFIEITPNVSHATLRNSVAPGCIFSESVMENRIVVTAENLQHVTLNLVITDKVQTKRSRLKKKAEKKGEKDVYIESEEAYSKVDAIEQTVKFTFANVELSELLHSRKGVLKSCRILYQDGVRKQDGDVMQWLRDNPTVDVDVDALIETKRGQGKSAVKMQEKVDNAKADILTTLLQLNLPDAKIMEIGLAHGLNEERVKKILKLRENKR